MICSFIVTIILMISESTKSNPDGILKVKQYRYSQFISANKMVRENLLSLGAGLSNQSYPKVIGVNLQKIKDFKCNFDGEEYL